MDQPKKFRILLKPFGDPDEFRKIKRLRRELEHGFPVSSEDPAAAIAHYEESIRDLPPRVIDADFIKVVSDGTMLAGIGPTNQRVQFLKGFMGGGSRGGAGRTGVIKYKKSHPEFYSLKWVPGAQDRPRHEKDAHGAYEFRQKFDKILSINLANVISVNGKPVVNLSLRDLNAGLKHLELDEWSINKIADLLE